MANFGPKLTQTDQYLGELRQKMAQLDKLSTNTWPKAILVAPFLVAGAVACHMCLLCCRLRAWSSLARGPRGRQELSYAELCERLDFLHTQEQQRRARTASAAKPVLAPQAADGGVAAEQGAEGGEAAGGGEAAAAAAAVLPPAVRAVAEVGLVWGSHLSQCRGRPAGGHRPY